MHHISSTTAFFILHPSLRYLSHNHPPYVYSLYFFFGLLMCLLVFRPRVRSGPVGLSDKRADLFYTCSALQVMSLFSKRCWMLYCGLVTWPRVIFELLLVPA